jgi:hypothetical protein
MKVCVSFYIFCGLFNGAFSIEPVTLLDGGMLDEWWIGIWKEAVMA